MSAEVDPVDGEPLASKGEVSRPEESEIDMLVAHELASGSPAAVLIWNAAGVAPPASPPTIARQYQLDGRPVDLMVGSNRIKVLIEDKRADGYFEEGQAEYYRELLRKGECTSTVLIAPTSFLNTHKEQVGWFTGSVSVEELASALNRGVPQGAAAEAELAASYSYRAKRLTECAKSAGPSPVDPEKTTFGEAYRELLRKMGVRGVQVSSGSMKRKHTTAIEFDRWGDPAPAQYQPYHELYKGYLYFRVPGCGLSRF